MKGSSIILPGIGFGLGFGIGLLVNGKKSKPTDLTTLHAPISGVPFIGWEKFVGTMAVVPRETVSPRYKLGTFQMDARRLKDVGLMQEARKGVYGNQSGVWLGKWTPPLTESKFLRSMPLQYAAFVRSMRAAAPKVSGLVGRVVDGAEATLSGLLGVCHAAGEGGVGGWVEDARTRERFPGTTTLFAKTNGLF